MVSLFSETSDLIQLYILKLSDYLLPGGCSDPTVDPETVVLYVYFLVVALTQQKTLKLLCCRSTSWWLL